MGVSCGTTYGVSGHLPLAPLATPGAVTSTAPGATQVTLFRERDRDNGDTASALHEVLGEERFVD
jgi:hypothetical protein